MEYHIFSTQIFVEHVEATNPVGDGIEVEENDRVVFQELVPTRNEFVVDEVENNDLRPPTVEFDSPTPEIGTLRRSFLQTEYQQALAKEDTTTTELGLRYEQEAFLHLRRSKLIAMEEGELRLDRDEEKTRKEEWE